MQSNYFSLSQCSVKVLPNEKAKTRFLLDIKNKCRELNFEEIHNRLKFLNSKKPFGMTEHFLIINTFSRKGQSLKASKVALFCLLNLMTAVKCILENFHLSFRRAYGGGSSVRCPNHPNTLLVEDYRAGDMVCPDCGLVVGDR